MTLGTESVKFFKLSEHFDFILSSSCKLELSLNTDRLESSKLSIDSNDLDNVKLTISDTMTNNDFKGTNEGTYTHNDYKLQLQFAGFPL